MLPGGVIGSTAGSEPASEGSNPSLGTNEPAVDWTPFIRPPTLADERYIRATWVSSYRNSPWAGTIPNNLFDSVCAETYAQLILRGMSLRVCSNPANPEQLLGWIAFEAAADGSVCVHHAFTKPLFRQLGINSHLLAAAGVTEGASFFYTHKTQSSRFLKGGKYRPEIARRRDFGPSPTREQRH